MFFSKFAINALPYSKQTLEVRRVQRQCLQALNADVFAQKCPRPVFVVSYSHYTVFDRRERLPSVCARHPPGSSIERWIDDKAASAYASVTLTPITRCCHSIISRAFHSRQFQRSQSIHYFMLHLLERSTIVNTSRTSRRSALTACISFCTFL